MRIGTTLDDENQVDDDEESAVTTIIKDGQYIMVIEVKRSFATDFTVTDTHDCIEMILYCYYMMRLYNVEVVLGTAMDGYV